jgi:PAS domain S-box-containing protein
MEAPMRRTGIDVIGNAPWGTHFCQFYQTKQDLIDILVPYFRQGLADNEFCMWITSEPLGVDEATAALRSVVPALDEYIRKGQIEILDFTQWYTPHGRFDADQVLRAWAQKLERALDRGYEGLRLAGTTFWLEDQHWAELIGYEEAINRTIGNHRMLAVCTYSLEKCGAHEVMDVVSNHRCALVKRSGHWQVIESSEHRKTQAALRESEERLSRAQEIAHLGSWELDLAADELTWSDEVYRIFGLQPQEFGATYEAFLEHVHPDDRAAVDAAYTGSVREGKDSYEIEHRVLRKNTGEIRWVQERCQHVRDAKGRIVRSLGMVLDITERKRAEEALRRARDSLEVSVGERTAELRQANERLRAENAARLRIERALRLEQSRLDALLHLSELSHASVAEIAAFTLERAVALTASNIGFVGLLSEDEKVYTLHAASKTVVRECNVAGDPVQWHVAGAGIWADAIRQRRTLFINDYSQPYPAKKGLPPGHLPLQRFLAVPAFDGEKIVAILGVGNKAKDYDHSDERQIALLLAGMWNYVQRNQAREALQRAHDELEGRVRQRTAQLAAANVALEEEIADRKRAEEALRHSAERLRLQHEIDRTILSSRSAGEMAQAVLCQLPRLLPCQRAGINLLDPEAQEVWLLATYSAGETSLAKGWRAPVAEALGDTIAQLARGERSVVDDMQALAPWSPLAEQLQAEGVRAEVLQPLIVRGELIGVLRIGMSVPGPLPEEQLEAVHQLADALAVGIQQMRLYEQVRRHALELEERVRARTAELASSEARFRAVYEQAAIGIALLDERGRLLSSNPALQRILGYSEQELAGLPLSALAEGMDGIGEGGTSLPPAGGGGGGQSGRAREFRFTSPAPTGEMSGLFSPPPVDPGPLGPGTKGDTLQGRGIEGGQPSLPYDQAEQLYQRKDGGTIHANVTTSPIHLEGEPARLSVALIEDVTERVQAQEALRRSEQLALTGRLAASVAHEIGNPLQAVIGCLGLAEEMEPGDERMERYMRLAMEELQRAARLVGRMRDLNRPSEGKREAVDVNALVEKVLLLSKKQCQSQGVQVAWEAGQGLPAIAAVPDRVQQVFLNLALNAVDAMPGGGQLAVRTGQTGDPAGVEVTFADTGTGIPAEQLEQLFEPFMSTKAQGLGLGLYVCRNIVQEHGGRIDVQSKVGHGTTFTVWLPAQ